MAEPKSFSDWLADLEDPETWNEVMARAGLVAVVALGTTVAVMMSYLTQLASGPIPYKLIPDMRPVLVFGLTAMVGGLAAAGPGRRRSFLVYYLVIVHLIFAIDLATIHWFAAIPGSLVGTRTDPLRLIATLVALTGALLLQARVHGFRLATELADRGVPDEDLTDLPNALRRAARRAILPLAGAVAGLGVLVEAASLVIGDEAGMPMAGGLLLGAAALAGLGYVLGKWNVGRTTNH